jgi:hypothetical protein
MHRHALWFHLQRNTRTQIRNPTTAVEMESTAKRTKTPVDPWKLVTQLITEAEAKGIQAAYDMLLQRLDDLSDSVLAYPILKHVKIPQGIDVPQRIKTAQKFSWTLENFRDQAQSSLDFGRSVETFQRIFTDARTLPAALFREFMSTAANPGHWQRCADKIMVAFARIDNPPLDDADFAHIKSVFATEDGGYVTPRMLRAMPHDASPRMKAMIGAIGVKMDELRAAVDAYVVCGVDPLSVDGANKELCAIVRKAREFMQQ